MSIPDADVLLTFPTRIPVQTGDVIGVYSAPASVFLCAKSAPGYTVHQGPFGPDVPAGTTAAFTPVSDLQLDLSALLEADADADGFGDETQDGCPTDATTQAACPDKTAPETTITSGPQRHSAKPKAKFGFVSSEAGSTFQCRLKGKEAAPAVKQFGACSSPRKYRHLAPGKYKFLVFAADPAGNADTTPDKQKFRVLDEG